MSDAVRSFFSLQLRRAASQLDDAYFSIRGDQEPSDFEKVAISQRISVAPLLSDAEQATLRIAFSKFYENRAPEGLKWQVHLELRRPDGSVIDATTLDKPEEGEKMSWTTAAGMEGDFQLIASWKSGDAEFPLLDTQISRVKNLAARCELLKATAEQSVVGRNATLHATLRDWGEVLGKLQQEEVLECDYPAARLLQLAGRISSDPAKSNEILFAEARENDLWITLANEKQEAPLRVRAPAKSEGLLPVLFLFHGAGGSENMFFETYGAGKTVKLGIERGWLVVAPRQGFFGLGMDCEAMLAALEEIFPIDRKRIAMVGHSMGAAQVIRQAGVKPELFRAAVALGGGNAISKPERVKSIAWFVAAGEQDFGRAGAASLAKSLQRAEVRLKNKTYPEVEHLMIVQAALDDLFEFLDEVMK